MTKISNQYSLTNILTADLANSRLGINNVSPAYSLDLTGTARVSTSAYFATASGSVGIGTSSPATKLHVEATSPTRGLICTIKNTTQTGTQVHFVQDSVADWVIGQPANTNAFAFWNNRNLGNDGNERMRITSAGNVGIGAGSPDQKLVINQEATSTGQGIPATTGTTQNGILRLRPAIALYGETLDFGMNVATTYGWIQATNANNLATNYALALNPNGGNVGIGTTTPSTKLVVTGGVTNSIATISAYIGTNNAIAIGDDGTNAVLAVSNSSTDMVFLKRVAGVYSEAMRIKSGGNVGIGTTTPGVKLEVNGGGAAVAMTIATSGSTTAGCLWDGGGAPSFHAWSRPDDCGIGSNNFAGKSILIKTGMTYGSFTTGTTRIEIQSGGAVVIPGSLSKGSGSFRIDHPLKSDTHQLVHSFIEGPQADLIYRGKLTLVNGKAQANIDEVSTMTEGTFEALCREVQCFTTNENGWDLVKGKVIGNIIYIESQNTNSTDEISWMVIGERKDKHMMDTEWTDEQGKVIVEPLKEK
jgi:hypothetical protein